MQTMRCRNRAHTLFQPLRVGFIVILWGKWGGAATPRIPWWTHPLGYIIFFVVLFSDSFISSQVHSQVKSFDCRLRITRECIRMPGICIANNNNNGLKKQNRSSNNNILRPYGRRYVACGLRYADYGLRIAVRAPDPKASPCWLPNKSLTIKCTIAIRPHFFFQRKDVGG